MDLYNTLEVPKNADKAQITRAYRKKAQKLHPDRPGGDTEKFHQITIAYEVLTDDAKRAHYDAHGDVGHKDRSSEIHDRVARLFLQFVESQQMDGADIIVLMRQSILSGKAETETQIREAERKIARYEKMKSRVRKKSGGQNLLTAMLDGQISAMRRSIAMARDDIDKQIDMLKMLDDYEYQAAGPDQTMHALMGIAARGVFG